MSQQQQTTTMQQELNDLDRQIARARREIQALRGERSHRGVEHSFMAEALEAEYQDTKSSLEKNLNQLGLSAYKNAVLETQTAAVQPYILQKLAVLCHALHHTEVVAKQIQMMQKSSEELETVLQKSIDQIEDFWEPRLLHLKESVRWSKQQVHDFASRLPNGAEFLRAGEEQKENDDPASPTSTMLVSVLSMVMAAGGFNQAPLQNKVGRRHSLSFLPFAQTKKSAEAPCTQEKAVSSLKIPSFNSAQRRRCSA